MLELLAAAEIDREGTGDASRAVGSCLGLLVDSADVDPVRAPVT